MPDDVPELGPEELRDRLDGETPPRVVDIRPPARYRAGHVPGAVNVPFGELPARVPEMEFDADRDVVVACPVGESSRKAARLVRSYEGVPEEVTVASLAGGYREWDGDLATGADADGADGSSGGDRRANDGASEDDGDDTGADPGGAPF